MRVATTKGTLRVPPTYFAVSHAARLTQVDAQLFTLVADVTDPTVRVRVHEAVPRWGRPFRQREIVMPAFMPVMTTQVRRFQPDVVHQHFATWCAPAVAAARGRAPLLTTLHGVDAFAGLLPPHTAMAHWHLYNVRLAQRHSARFLVVSRYLADVARTAGFDSSRLHVHYQGVDTDYFTPAESRPESALPTVVFVGALVEQKGLPDLLEASRRLRQHTPHQLVVAGTGPLRPQADHFAAEHPDVTVLGGVDRDQVRALLRRADVLVMPSQQSGGRSEAAGLVALEAQACGTPVVAYRSGGIPEMLADGSTGVLVTEKDVAGLTAGLRDVLSQSAPELGQLRTRARRWVVEHRSLDVSCRELEAHYRDVAG